MSLMNTNAFKPIRVGNLLLSSRITLAPLTRLRSKNHVINDKTIEYYGQRAKTPGTLLVTEATAIRPEAIAYGSEPGIWSPKQVDTWKNVTEAVHKRGSFIFMQLWAVGRQAMPKVLARNGFEVVSASGIPADKRYPKPHALTQQEIGEYVDWFADAAQNAISAGFDGVEIHGANGYLLDEFLYEGANIRTDEFGGSLENRARFPLQVLDAVIDSVGANRVGYRISPWQTFGGIELGDAPEHRWKFLLEEFQKRADAGREIAYVSAMEPRIDAVERDDRLKSHDLNNFIRESWHGKIIRNGDFGNHLEDIAHVVEDPNVLIGIGRNSISNPDFVNRIKHGTELEPYNRPTFYWTGKFPLEVGYTKYLTPEQSRAHGYP